MSKKLNYPVLVHVQAVTQVAEGHVSCTDINDHARNKTG